MSDALELLEWPVLFKHLTGQCLTPYGVRAWETHPFLHGADAVEQHLAEVDALKILVLRYGEPVSEINVPDIQTTIKRLAKEGFLNMNEIREVTRTLTGGGKLLRHFVRNLKHEGQLEILRPILDESQFPTHVEEQLFRYVDKDGELKDSASPQLGTLRNKLRHQRHAIRQKLQHFLQHPDYSSALQSTTPTEREGRTVLVVKVEAKSKLPGIIHGASGSGSTIYVEPQALVGLNNDLAATQAELQREIDRLLQEISRMLQEEWEPLQAFIDALSVLDRRLAAARFSRWLDAQPVTIERNTLAMDLKASRHPLLVIQSKQQNKHVVPNDLRIGYEGIRTLVITGPNTGGKTVLLKTAGLFALMLKAGLHLPVGDGSSMALFDPVLADIGDAQSLAQSLSTFSAHIERLKSFLAEETDLSRALVLVDEIAAGTDPAEGAALAKAILDELYNKGAITLVSTHLGELKVDAHAHTGFMNASVEFDAETLSPTYRLILGVPGASNAITIAHRLGMKDAVISKARNLLSTPVRESADLLQELETKNRQLEDELQRARSYRLEAQEEYEKLSFARQTLEEEKRQSLKLFQTSLKSRIHDLENQVKHMRKEIQQEGLQLDESRLDALNKKLRDTNHGADEAFHETREGMRETDLLTLAEITIGEQLFSRQLEITGEVTKLLPSTNEVILQSGIMRVTVPVEDLEKPHPGRKRKAQSRPALPTMKVAGNVSVLDEPRDASLTCDVRGQRFDEAMETVQRFLDDALLSGFESVAVVHGLGTGALKKGIREYLKNASFVMRYYPAEARLGGDGKTIIELANTSES